MCVGQDYQKFRYCRDQAKEKYRGMFKIQKSGDKTSSGEIGLDIRTHASPKVGQDQVSGGVSVLCWHAAPRLSTLTDVNSSKNHSSLFVDPFQHH